MPNEILGVSDVLANQTLPNSTFDTLTEEEKNALLDYYSNTISLYSTQQSNNKKWKVIADDITTSNFITGTDQRLEKPIDNKSKTIFNEKTESPIFQNILDYKTVDLLRTSIIPRVTHYDIAYKAIDSKENTNKTDLTATQNGVSKNSVTQTKEFNPETEVLKLNRVLLSLEREIFKTDKKKKTIINANKYGVGVVKIINSSDYEIKTPKDIDVKIINLENLYYDTTKDLPFVNEVIESGVINASAYNQLADVYKYRYDLKYGTDPNDYIQGNAIKGEDLEYSEMYFTSNLNKEKRNEKITKLVILGGVLVDVIELPNKLIPYVSLRFDYTKEQYKNSIIYKNEDVYKAIVRMDTAIQKLTQFLQAPQFEIKLNSLKLNQKVLKVLLQTPGAILPSKDAQSVRIITRENQLMELIKLRDFYTSILFSSVGLSKFNMGQNTGSLQTSAGVNQMIQQANEPTASLIPDYENFLVNSFKVLLDLILYNSSDFVYLSMNDRAMNFIDNFKTKDIKNKSKISLAVETTANVVNESVAKNDLLQLYVTARQSTDPNIKSEANAILQTLIEMIPMNMEDKLKLEIKLSENFNAMIDESNVASAKAAANATAMSIQQATTQGRNKTITPG